MQSLIDTVIFVFALFSILTVIVLCFETYRDNKLRNIPSHYTQALSEAGYTLYCDYKNRWFTWNRWGIMKHGQTRPIIIVTADNFYPKLKNCFTYTTNKIHINEERLKALHDSCNVVKPKRLKEW